MKANEFAKTQSGDKKSPEPTPVIKSPISEAKKLKFKRPSPTHRSKEATAPEGAADVLGPNVTIAPGSELHRIRSHNPTLWTKIQNWD